MSKEIGIGILVFAGFIAFVCMIDYTGLMWESFIGPKRENVRRNIYEQTESFNEGKKQQLAKYKFEYDQADRKHDEDSKIGICTAVRQTFANYDTSKLPFAEHQFVRECGGF